MKFYFKKKKRVKKEDMMLDARIQDKLEPYLKRDEIEAILHKREADEELERKRRVWNSLSNSQKMRLMRYRKAHQGEQNEK